jgi:stress response protein YsnF
MSEIDRQRVRGVEVLREMGFTWRNGRWLPPVSAENQTAMVPAADAMHRVLVERADRLVCENSDDEEELVQIGEAIETYEAKRWPEGKEPGGKG